MAKLAKNYIELVTGVEGDEVQTQVYYTPAFIPFKVVYEAMDLLDAGSKKTERQMFDELATFISDRVYDGQFSKEDLMNGLHAPEAASILGKQVEFVASGNQSDEQKKFLKEKTR